MIDVTHKVYTLRKAIASAIVRTGNIETINAVKEKRVPKGDVLNVQELRVYSP